MRRIKVPIDIKVIHSRSAGFVISTVQNMNISLKSLQIYRSYGAKKGFGIFISTNILLLRSNVCSEI